MATNALSPFAHIKQKCRDILLPPRDYYVRDVITRQNVTCNLSCSVALACSV